MEKPKEKNQSKVAAEPEVLENNNAGASQANSTLENQNPPQESPLAVKKDKEEAKLKEHIEKINEMLADKLFETAIEVGNYILQHFFNNQIEEAMSRNPKKATSYRKLAQRNDLKIKFNILNQMVRVAAQEKFLEYKISKKLLEKLSYSHRIELLKVEDANEKIIIANTVIQEEISVRGIKGLIGDKPDDGGKSEVLIYSNVLQKVLNEFSDVKNLKSKLYEMSLTKIEKYNKNIDIFIEKVDKDKKSLLNIQKEIKPILEEKKQEEEEKKNKRRGRPRKQS